MKVKITSIPENSSLPLKVLLQKMCLLRTSEKIGDIENVNNTQIGRMNLQGVGFEVIK